MEESIISLTYLALAILVAVGNILLGDYIQEMTLYRNKEFLSIIKNIKNLEGKIQKEEKKNESKGENPEKNEANKKVKQFQDQIDQYNIDLAKIKFRGNLPQIVFFFVSTWIQGKIFKDIPVVKLPFVPFFFIKKIFQRGLTTENDSLGSYMFITTLVGIILRENLFYFKGRQKFETQQGLLESKLKEE